MLLNLTILKYLYCIGIYPSTNWYATLVFHYLQPKVYSFFRSKNYKNEQKSINTCIQARFSFTVIRFFSYYVLNTSWKWPSKRLVGICLFPRSLICKAETGLSRDGAFSQLKKDKLLLLHWVKPAFVAHNSYLRLDQNDHFIHCTVKMIHGGNLFNLDRLIFYLY